MPVETSTTSPAKTLVTDGWLVVCAVDEVPRLGARVVRLPQGDVALFRAGDGALFALADQCPHRAGPLSQGIVHGRRVTCPLHNWVVGLDDGKAVAPDEGCVEVYEVAVQDGMIHLRLSSGGPGQSA